jgi:hypothetical protein
MPGNLARRPEPLRRTCLLKPFGPPRLVDAVNDLRRRRVG